MRKIRRNTHLPSYREAFNIFNHSNFSEPNAVVFSGNGISSSAGLITSTATFSRQIQFALKLMF